METVIYEVRDYSLGANEETEDFIPAAMIRIMSATGDIAIAFGTAGSYQRIEAGIAVRTLKPFDRVRIKDISGSSNTVRIAYAGSDVADSRLTITGGLLGVDDPVSGDSFSDVVTALESVVTALSSDTDLRAGLTTLEGATHYQAINTTLTVVTAVGNTDGAIIRLAQIANYGAVGALMVDDDDILRHSHYSSAGPTQIRDIYVPAGSKISMSSADASCRVDAWIEVL